MDKERETFVGNDYECNCRLTLPNDQQERCLEPPRRFWNTQKMNRMKIFQMKFWENIQKIMRKTSLPKKMLIFRIWCHKIREKLNKSPNEEQNLLSQISSFNYWWTFEVITNSQNVEQNVLVCWNNNKEQTFVTFENLNCLWNELSTKINGKIKDLLCSETKIE